MKNLVMFFLVSGVLFSSVELKASDEEQGQACMYEQYQFCLEGWAADGNADCDRDSGVVMDECPTENRIATCQVERDGRVVFTRYYAGTRVNPVKICKAAGGVYIPG
jgi:hypothetical protein